jgi:hypothetical protein
LKLSASLDGSGGASGDGSGDGSVVRICFSDESGKYHFGRDEIIALTELVGRHQSDCSRIVIVALRSFNFGGKNRISTKIV